MPRVEVRGDYTAAKVRELATGCAHGDQARRLLSIAAIYDGMSRADAARIGGMDRQTLRDWVHRFNAEGPAGLINRKAPGARPKLSEEQKAELVEMVKAGPDPEKDGVVRWRRVDLKEKLRTKYGVVYHERSVSRLLHDLGFSHISARPQHPGQDQEAIETFKKTSPSLSPTQ